MKTTSISVCIICCRTRRNDDFT